VTEGVTEKEATILALIKANNQIATTELAETLSVSSNTISARIKAMKEKGVLARIGSDTKGTWEIID